MTYREIKEILSSANIADAAYEARLLISRFCGVSPSDVLSDGRNYTSPELDGAVKKRAGRYPLQYIIGEWGFCTEVYSVGPGVLIPRPDTELLVEEAVKRIPENSLFIDLGTGSGCVAVSTLVRRPDCRAVCVDVSPDALSYARRNAVRNGVGDRISFVEGDMLSPELAGSLASFGKIGAVLSNPPYIASETVPGLAPELSFEPRLALDGGGDGLIFYRSVISSFAPLTKLMIFEVGAGQADGVSDIGRSFGFAAGTVPDINGIGRDVVLRKD